MTDYIVQSIFRDAKGKELRRSCTFKGDTGDARDALVHAHEAMLPLVTADSRIDNISSSVVGGGETINTVDYADELDCGTSASGLMNEIDASMLDGRAEQAVMQDALDILTDKQKAKLLDKDATESFGDGIFNPDSPAQQGGADADGSGTFPDGHTHGAGIEPRLLGQDSRDANGSAQHFPHNTHGRVGDVGTGADRVSSRSINDPSKLPTASSGRSNSVRPTSSSLPLGAPYQGTDIIGDIIRAKESMEKALGRDRVPTAIRCGQSAYDALVKAVQKERGQVPINITIAGLPVVLHDDPNMAPIQVEVGTKGNPFDMMGLNPEQRNYGFGDGSCPLATGRHVVQKFDPVHWDTEHKLIIVDETRDISPETWSKLTSGIHSMNKTDTTKRDAMRHHYYLGKWEDDNE